LQSLHYIQIRLASSDDSQIASGGGEGFPVQTILSGESNGRGQPFSLYDLIQARRIEAL